MPCELCDLKKRTTWLHEDDLCVVCVSKDQRGSILRIMVVPKSHASAIHGHLYNHCMAQLNKVADMLVSDRKQRLRGYVMDTSMRRVKDHWHQHVRFHR